MMMKKICFFLAILVMLVPFSVCAETNSGTCGSGVSWSFNAKNGTLSITGSGSMSDFAETENRPWNSISSSVKTVTVGEGVTHIGKNSFRRMLSLTSVSLPKSLVSIGDKAFAYDDGLTYVNIPDSVSYIGDSSFYFCKNLSEILLPSALLKISDNCFFACGGISYISIPDKVTAIGKNAFYFCGLLESVRFPKSLKTVSQSAFDKCDKLKTISYTGNEAEWLKVNVESGNAKIKSVNIYYSSSTAGDLNRDNKVDVNDAVYLLYHCFFPIDYPCTENADYDRNGYVNQDDAIYLLYHCFFPSEYLL